MRYNQNFKKERSYSPGILLINLALKIHFFQIRAKKNWTEKRRKLSKTKRGYYFAVKEEYDFAANAFFFAFIISQRVSAFSHDQYVCVIYLPRDFNVKFLVTLGIHGHNF